MGDSQSWMNWGCMIDLGKIMIGDLGMYDLVDDLDTN